MSNPQEPYQPGQPAPWPQKPAATEPGNPGQYGAPPQPRNAPQFGASGRYAAEGPFGLPGQEPPAQGHRKLWTILGVACGVLVLVAVGLVILLNVVNGPTNHARGLADGFTKLVIAGDTSTAYDNYLDPALHEQLSKEDFIAGIKTLEMNDSCKPAYNDVTASTEGGTKAADVTGVITCDGDKKIDLVYRFEGADELKMINIKLKPQA